MAKNKKKKKGKILISVLPGEQVELAVLHDGLLREYYIEMVHQAKTKGNIYKGKIHNIDSSLQAAFISYGMKKNGFLQIDEVHPEYYREGVEAGKGGKYPPIQKALKAGMEVLVQVVKEPVGAKGAFLTTYLSIPGRYLVLMPGSDQVGVSRKIEDEKERVRLKKTIEGLEVEDGLGVIVRTAGGGSTKAELLRDYQFLKRLWKDIRKKGQESSSPSIVYEERGLAYRAVRDYLTQDVEEIWVDHQPTAEIVAEAVGLIFPRGRTGIVKTHTDTERTLWERFGLEKQIANVCEREINLPSGGRIIIEQTEALTSVDVNSGKIGGESTFRDMVLKTNMEAAEEVVRQLILRDIGGQIVIDFIEMKDAKHCREVERSIRVAVKNDRARIDVGKISGFGMLEIVRQKLGSSAMAVSTEICPCCKGLGTRRNLEWQAIQALKNIYHRLRRKDCPATLEYKTGHETAFYLLNNKRAKLAQLETDFDKTIVISQEQ